MCKAIGVLRCPECKRQINVTRPDSLHPFYSLKKPRESDVESDVIEQVYTCKNPECESNVTVYWYETKLFLDRE